MTIISAQELAGLLRKKSVVLLHVLPEEHFAAGHLPGALNLCAYETAFLQRVQEAVPELDTPLVVYGEGGASLDSQVAAERLRTAGYTQVQDLRGGLSEWRAAGLPVEADPDAPAAGIPDGEFSVEVEKSLVRWTGRNLFNHHEGTLKVAAGRLTLKAGALTGAEFLLDMRSIACSDLTDSMWNKLLLDHLASDDFFASAQHPLARCVIESATPVQGCTAGVPNYLLSGHLTLRGITRPISFPAVVAAADADHLTGQAEFALDRTEFGSQYGSGKFFAALGKHLVNDHVHLHLKIHALRLPN